MDTSTRGVTAIVDYDYSANEPDELDLVKGAILHNIKVQPGGWWEGTLTSNGKTGMFPDNFIHIIDPDEKSPVVLRDKSSTVYRRCKVIYSYTQQNEDELSLGVGNIIEVLGEVEEGWWRGQLGDKVGVFPSNFVEALPASPVLANKRPSPVPNSTHTTNSTKRENRSLHSSREDLLSTSPSSNIIVDNKDAPILPPKPVREYCRVLYPYDPQNEDELELQVGEVITVISKDLPDRGWWRGELRGRVGVFPDNFVKLLPPEVSPSKEPLVTEKPPSAGGTLSTTSSSAKVFVKKSGSGSSSQSSTRKDSFGSRDSLNDILSETGIISGNVAAQRKSLENKNFDLSSGMAGGDAKLRRSVETKTAEIRKSLDNADDKKTPPPVLGKKPLVPVKKSTSVTSVAGSLLSGLKQKVKSVEHKVSSHDSMDGIMSSRPLSQVSDTNEKGIVGERLRKSDSEFDHVERDSLLSDMRANRVKAPRRRPPSAAINAIGESNNNDSTYLNGTSTYTEVIHSESRSDSLEAEELVKPKPRGWEKKKVPWMDELKASQMKKTSPSVEPRAGDRLSKIIDAESVHKLSSEMTRSLTNNHSSSSSVSAAQRKMESTSSISHQSSLTSSSYEVKSTAIETSAKREYNDISKSMLSSSSSVATTKSPTVLTETPTISTSATTPTTTSLPDDLKSRPTSLSILNRSISPIGGRTTTATTTSATGSSKTLTTSTATIFSSITTAAAENSVNLTGATVGAAPSVSAAPAVANSIVVPVTQENVCSRIMELDERILKLESVVQTQNRIIDELVRSLKEETDRVKGLKTELEKYAQCVTQV